MFNLSDLPNTPIDMETFAADASARLSELGVFVSDDTPKVLKQLCGVLNLSITNPKVGKLVNKQLWAFPAQTGVGKSVALQLYVAKLAEHDIGCLIAVALKESTKGYSEQINDLVGVDEDEVYAGCYYYSKTKHKHENYVTLPDGMELKDLGKSESRFYRYPCVIITHSRYQRLNGQELKDVGQYRAKDGTLKNRQLIVIDEKPSYYSNSVVSMSEFKRLLAFLENAMQHSPKSMELTSSERLSEPLRHLFNYLQNLEIDESKPVQYISEVDVYNCIDEQDIEDPSIESDQIEAVIKARFTEICNEVEKASGEVFTTPTSKEIQERQTKVLKIATNLMRILVDRREEDYGCYSPFIFYKTNRDHYLITVSSRYTELGTTVVMDATASVNELYKRADKKNFSNIKLLDVPQIRKYENLTVYQAEGFPQSRSGIYSKDLQTKDKSTKLYLSVIDSILEEEDKLLVVCHKDFEATLKSNTEDTRVRFTHWGDHIGSNQWNDCNKVIIIGWNYLSPTEDLSRIYGSTFGTKNLFTTQAMDKALIETFSTTQIVDDIVQAVMRTKARIIATADSDCQAASIYLLYPNTGFGKNVMQLVNTQFPKANIIDWKPDLPSDLIKKSKPEQNADLILNLLIQHHAAKTKEVPYQSIREESNLSKSYFSKAIKTPYFEQQLEKHRFIIEQINGKSKKFVLGT